MFERLFSKSSPFLHQNQEKQMDGLITILRNTVLAFQSEGSIEEKFQELENLIGGDPGLRVLDDCYAGNNYFSFIWRHLKRSRADLIKNIRNVKIQVDKSK